MNKAGARPRVPPGQVVTDRWPVLHAGPVPKVNLGQWRFRVWGEVEVPAQWTYEEFLALGHVRVTGDVHCVTGWSRLDNTWEGVPARVVVERVRPRPGAEYVLVHAEGGYTTNLQVADLVRDDVLFAYRHDGRELTPEHGWPLRLVVPHLYFWKSAKWVHGLEFLREEHLGFWEQEGYHRRGDPWREERYAWDERTS
ncbi:MAG: sulfite oxidase-like oxidoreductase [Clostridia bacterium]|nr:sulfite oxidase-like oxidoreductase [Clostridia bacterium]